MNMKLGKLKWLKIVGIIAIVAGVLALAVWGIISLVNKEKVYINAFADEVDKEIDTKITAFENLNSKRMDLYDFVDANLSLKLCTNENISQRINLVKNNFSVIGLKSSERKTVDNIVSNLTKYRASLASIYSQLAQISDKETITDEDALAFKNLFKESYLTNYELIIAEKTNLLNLLNSSLSKHNVKQPSYVESINSLSDITIEIIQKVNLPHVKKYNLFEDSYDYSLALINKLNTALVAINENSKTYNNSNLASMIIELDSSIKTFKEQYNEFISAYNNLTELEISTLSKDGIGFDYTITPATENLTKVVNFLKTDGIYHNITKNDSSIIKGIEL